MGNVKVSDSQAAEPTTRRGFYVGAIFGLWGIIGAGLGLPALVYLLFPPKPHKEDEWIDLGDISALQPGTPVEMVFRRNRKDGWKVISEKSTAWVVKQADQQIVAFGPQCTHLGCAYHWEDSKREFLCPCHTSLFSMDGKVTAGPAPRPLDRFDVKVENNHLKIGKLRESNA
jgi:menaquinol-cytochrome c reductase iron-sulfur subunit